MEIDVLPCLSHFPPTVWGKIKLDCRASNNISVQVYDHSIQAHAQGYVLMSDRS